MLSFEPALNPSATGSTSTVESSGQSAYFCDSSTSSALGEFIEGGTIRRSASVPNNRYGTFAV